MTFGSDECKWLGSDDGRLGVEVQSYAEEFIEDPVSRHWETARLGSSEEGERQSHAPGPVLKGVAQGPAWGG